MGPPEGRDQAITALKEALVRRYGETSRDIVDAEVQSRLAVRARLEVSDVDAIEQRVLAAKRSQRGIGGTHHRNAEVSRAVPSMASANGPARRKVPSSPGVPQQNPRRAQQQVKAATLPVPLATRPGISQQGEVAAAAPFSRTLPVETALKPPWGTGATRDQGMAGSCDPLRPNHVVTAGPKYPVPLRPRLKPMDHWDIMSAYEAVQHQKETDDYRYDGCRIEKKKCRDMLDAQMKETHVKRDREAEERRKERDDLEKYLAREKEQIAAEEEIREARRIKQMQTNDNMLEQHRQKQEQERDFRQCERAHMLNFLSEEQRRQAEEKRIKAEEHTRYCDAMRSQMLAAIEEQGERRKAEKEADNVMIREQIQQADDRLELNKQAVQKRLDQIERNSRTLGEAIAARDAKLERESEERMRRAQEEWDRATADAARRQEADRQKRVKEMLGTLDRQVQHRDEKKGIEKAAEEKQKEVWRLENIEFSEQERSKQEAARKARRHLDEELIEQIRHNVSIHPHHFGQTEEKTVQDCAINKHLYKKMAADEFYAGVTSCLSEVNDTGNRVAPKPKLGRARIRHPQREAVAEEF